MRTNIFRISILPLLFLLAFMVQPPQGNDKGNKSNKEKERGNQNDKVNQGKGNESKARGNNGNENRGNNGQANSNNKQDDNRNEGQGRNKNNNGNNGNSGNGRSGDNRGNTDDFKDNKGKGNNQGNGNGKSKRETVRWDRDDNIEWGLEDFSSRKRPKDFKKVTICHNTGSDNHPVTISVSENAMQAHLNHGDQLGDCGNGYSDLWPVNYLRTRENVYNAYENTWETMSYSEALIRYAAERLLGIRSNFQTQRATLSPEEIQRKEVLIMELQNNINSLENQLRTTQQRTDGVNINIML
ncbi:MAG TPA: hypothetical protein VGE58_03155 [Daejeonella sp.]